VAALPLRRHSMLRHGAGVDLQRFLLSSRCRVSLSLVLLLRTHRRIWDQKDLARLGSCPLLESENLGLGYLLGVERGLLHCLLAKVVIELVLKLLWIIWPRYISSFTRYGFPRLHILRLPRLLSHGFRRLHKLYSNRRLLPGSCCARQLYWWSFCLR